MEQVLLTIPERKTFLVGFSLFILSNYMHTRFKLHMVMFYDYHLKDVLFVLCHI